jgi:hypothetical protein
LAAFVRKLSANCPNGAIFRICCNPAAWVTSIGLLAQVKQISKNQVTNLLLNTSGGYFANKKNPAWQNQICQLLEKLLDIVYANEYTLSQLRPLKKPF